MNNRNYRVLAGPLVVGVIAISLCSPIFATTEAPSTPTILTAQQARAEGYFHMMNATLAARRGELRVVQREIDAAVEFDAKSATLRAVAAELFLALGQNDLAERWARQALSLDDGQRAALGILGEISYRRAISGAGTPETIEEAIGYFERLADGPTDEVEDETLQILVNLELQRNNMKRAESFLARLAERRPGDLLVHRQLVAMLARNGSTAEALEHLLVFVQRYGELDSFVQFLPGLMQRPDDWSRLADVLSERSEQEQPSPLLMNLATESYLRAGRYREAATLLEEQRTQDPGSVQIAEQLAAAYAAGGKLAEAVEFYRALTKQAPEDHDLHERLGQTLYRQRDLVGAIASWTVALDTVGTKAEAVESRDLLRWRLAMAELDSNRPGVAAQRLQEIEQPSGSDYQILRYRIALARDRYEEAGAAIDALEGLVSPGKIDLYAGERALQQGRFDIATPRLDQAAKRLGPEAITRIAGLWLEAGRNDQAEQLLRDRAKNFPQDSQALFALGQFLERDGRIDEAVELIEKGLQLDPDNSEMLNYLGYSLADAGRDLPRAIELIERALHDDPWNAAYLDSLGWAYFKSGDSLRAREPLEQAALDFPFDPVVLEHLGDLYFERGDRLRANSLWHRALAFLKNEDSRSLKEKLRLSEKATTRVASPADRDPS